MDYNLVITLTNGAKEEFLISIPDGVDGYSFQAKGSVALKSNLPDLATSEIGDSWIVEGGPKNEAGHLYIVGTEKLTETASPHLVWVDMGRIVGRDGKDGAGTNFDTNQFTTKEVDGKTVITIKNDPDIANQLSVIGKEGLFVRPASAQVRAKDKSVRVAGIPQDKNGGFNTEISVNLDTDVRNMLTVNDKGLHGILQSDISIGHTGGGNNSSMTTPAMWIANVENRTKKVMQQESVEQWNYNGKEYYATWERFTSVFGGEVYYVKRALYEYPTDNGRRRAMIVADTLNDPVQMRVMFDDPVIEGDVGNPFVSIQSGYQTYVPAKATTTSAVAVGESAESSGNSAIVLGPRSKALGDRNIIVGSGCEAKGSGQILIGTGIIDIWNNILIGNNCTASSGNSVLVGHGAKGAQGAIAVGASARAEYEGAITIGKDSVTHAYEAVTVGPHASASHKSSGAFGAGSLTTRENTISFGTASQLRILEHVAAGTALTDAVNLAQLQGETLVASWQGGNISWNYNDAKTADNAAGHWGESGCYLRFKAEVNAGDIIREVKLTSLPCRADGTIINHQVFVTTPRTANGETSCHVIVLMEEIPTHIVDPDTLTLTLAERADNGLQVGIPEIPVSETPGSRGQLHYSLAYFKKKVPQM